MQAVSRSIVLSKVFVPGTFMRCSMSNSLVSPEWELVDPTPDALALFAQYNKQFFWGKLESVVVTWSPRMTSCAGICCYEGRGGLCSIRLSTPLLKLRPRKDLVETLLHEMIHAYLFVTQNNRDRDGHGLEFQKHMHRINAEAKTNITIYHTFYDEVRHYKTHVWKCNGPCQHRKPYYGLVKRVSNRAPGPNDLWWKEHQSSCGGTYSKISEPEEFTKKQQLKKEKHEAKEKKEAEKRKSLITKYFNPVTDSKQSQVKGLSTSSTNSHKKPVSPGVNVLGSRNNLPASQTAPVRKIPGFGDIPVRVGVGSNQTFPTGSSAKPSTIVLDNTSFSKATENSTPSQSTSAKSNTPNTDSTRSGTSANKLTNTSTKGHANSESTGSKQKTQPLPVVLAFSDSDDDIPLLTTTSSNMSTPVHQTNSSCKRNRPPQTERQVINLSDSDEEQLDSLLNELKKKKRKPSCVKTTRPNIADEDSWQHTAQTPHTDHEPHTSTGVTTPQAATTKQKPSGGQAASSDQASPTHQPCPLCGFVLPVEVLPHHVEECAAADDITVVSPVESRNTDRVECPICCRSVTANYINEHLDSMCASQL